MSNDLRLRDKGLTIVSFVLRSWSISRFVEECQLCVEYLQENTASLPGS